MSWKGPGARGARRPRAPSRAAQVAEPIRAARPAARSGHGQCVTPRRLQMLRRQVDQSVRRWRSSTISSRDAGGGAVRRQRRDWRPEPIHRRAGRARPGPLRGGAVGRLSCQSFRWTSATSPTSSSVTRGEAPPDRVARGCGADHGGDHHTPVSTAREGHNYFRVEARLDRTRTACGRAWRALHAEVVVGPRAAVETGVMVSTVIGTASRATRSGGARRADRRRRR